MELATDVLVIGGGPAAAWAALTAIESGARVVLVDKGYLGTSGATAPSNTGTWFVAPGIGRRQAIEQRHARTGGLAEPRWAYRTLDTAWTQLHRLAERGYAFPTDDAGQPYLANLRGPDYMAFMRRLVVKSGVKVLDHHPALELLGHDGVVAGAAGIDRQRQQPWRIRSGATVLATGGCAFAERMLGATGLTGDGYLMAVEAGGVLSGMEFSSQYGIAPYASSLNKGLPYFWAHFSREDGTPVEDAARDRHGLVAAALLDGPLYARLDKADAATQDALRRGQPNIFLPFDRAGIDPFRDRFRITMRCEGTVRGVGGIRLIGDDGATDVPGLYAAGDAASRERLTGAITGGGGPNASWAIASGSWAGRGAAGFAGRIGPHAATRIARGLGRTGLRTAADPAATGEVLQLIKAEMLPLDRNFFRHGDGLRGSLSRLNRAWEDMSAGNEGPAPLDQVLRAREAAALVATSRWAYASALRRAESRGMHRRLDAPVRAAAFDGRVEVSGLDTVATHIAPITQEAAAS